MRLSMAPRHHYLTSRASISPHGRQTGATVHIRARRARRTRLCAFAAARARTRTGSSLCLRTSLAAHCLRVCFITACCSQDLCLLNGNDCRPAGFASSSLLARTSELPSQATFNHQLAAYPRNWQPTWAKEGRLELRYRRSLSGTDGRHLLRSFSRARQRRHGWMPLA